MKLTIVTSTYNRAYTLGKLYDSILQNLNSNFQIEWLIMDDGSTDNTKDLIQEYINQNEIQVKYFHQENQGKMQALNNVIEFATGDLIVEIDSDDYFLENAFKTIEEKYEEVKNDNTLYAMVFPRLLINGESRVINEDGLKTTMFELYLKHGLIGDSTLVFIANIRKQYKHKLENGEKFITEARMYNEMDLKYKIVYFKEKISVTEYLEDGYSKNINKQLFKNPYGYYKYYEQMFKFKLNEIDMKNKLHILKHYILFSYITKQKHPIKNVTGILNKISIMLLWIPGCVKIRILLKQ